MTATVGRLHVITDVSTQSRFGHVELARLAIAGGADVVQFRDKTMRIGERLAIATEIARMCRRSGVTFIVNDRADVAMAVDADGVHLGPDDLPVAAARNLLGPGRVIGASAGTPGAAVDAWKAGATYVGAGHVYPTGSKAKANLPIGVAGARQIAAAVPIPVIAIGGVTADNASTLIAARLHGIAVIGAVCQAGDPEHATGELRRIIDELWENDV